MRRTAILVGLAVGFGGGIAEARHRCVDPNHVLGYRRCQQFGAWSLITRLPAVTAGISVRARSLVIAPPPTLLARSSMAMSGPGTERVTAGGTAIGFAIGSHPFVGFELEIGAWMPSMVYGSFELPIGYRARLDRLELEVAAVPTLRVISAEPTHALLGGRVTAAWMWSPWWSVAAVAEADVGGASWMTGLAIVGHLRAFDVL